MRVSMVATGIDVDESEKTRSEPRGLAGPIPSVTHLPPISSSTDRVPPEGVERAPAAARNAEVEVQPGDGNDLTEGQEPSESEVQLPTPNDDYTVDATLETSQVEGVIESEGRADALMPDANDGLRTMDRREPFIPPRPTVVGAHDEGERQAEPFAAAAIENASADTHPKRRRGLTLFERMTGAGRNRDEQQDIADENAESSAASSSPQNPPSGIEASSTAQAHEPEQRMVAAQQPEASEATQPAFRGLGGEKREPSSPAEEEMLEIPAFLRRQAN